MFVRNDKIIYRIPIKHLKSQRSHAEREWSRDMISFRDRIKHNLKAHSSIILLSWLITIKSVFTNRVIKLRPGW